MPVYEYKCANGHNFEVLQRMSDDPVATCQVCEAPLERVFHPIAVHFKGSGFYTTDYKNKSGKARPSESGGSSEGGSGSSSSDKPAEKKPEKKSEKKDSAGATT